MTWPGGRDSLLSVGAGQPEQDRDPRIAVSPGYLRCGGHSALGDSDVGRDPDDAPAFLRERGRWRRWRMATRALSPREGARCP